LVEQFLKPNGTIFDVRSPGEYVQGHIPGALNLPLFSDSERAEVGTLYKQKGREEAIERGLHFAGPKLSKFVAFVKQQKTALAKVHCWRGGMRSSSVAWLLQTAGIPTLTLPGGYKSYRRYVLDILKTKRTLIVLGGLTGSGKSAILSCLKSKGEQILNLEELACHKGSSYGHLHMPPQPTYEQFENEVSHILSACDLNRPLWVEDESRMIGRCKIPDPLFVQMQESSFIFIDCPLEERLERLLQEYGQTDPRALITATRGLSKRLGGSRTEEAVTLIEQGQVKEAIALTLVYYDTSYQYGLKKRRQPYLKLSEKQLTPVDWAHLLIEAKDEKIAH
jgi:tRNA 2-selenouridine synthase